MKNTDIAMIVLIAVASITVAYFATNAIMGNASREPVKVDKIDKIQISIVQPDSRIFNEQAINPSVGVQIIPNGQ